MSFLEASSHRRLNPLTSEWVLVSPHRNERPWMGQTEETTQENVSTYNPDCYLCPGNHRAHGAVNPDYQRTFVFDNDFPALQMNVGSHAIRREGLMVAEAEPGICRVICFSPRHDLTLARMSVEEIECVVGIWGEQYRTLKDIDGINAVQIFENRGEMMGASNPHPHCQVWATGTPPNEMTKEFASQSAYWRQHGSPLLIDYLRLEQVARERIVFENEHFSVVVPFWAIWPFETMVLPHRHVGSVEELTVAESTALAAALRELTIRYDNLFETSFPYSMGFHQRPTDGGVHAEWQLHAHFYPPLLRSATVRKFMVGFEMLGSPQRDITAESAAARLRALPAIHYRDRERA